ncbi:MAG TPA: hypothetical protein DCE42_03995 [Myxococcales bacterium]|nr:hypothetical protein [Deltaproteobacteria bacterium]HAA53888.1 hypothetical protein [Myxococcales bacterium]
MRNRVFQQVNQRVETVFIDKKFHRNDILSRLEDVLCSAFFGLYRFVCCRGVFLSWEMIYIVGDYL